MKAARTALGGGRQLVGPVSPGVAIDAVARAIMAERERTAKIAETLGVTPELNVFGGGPEWFRHGRDIAAAIRRGN